MKISFDFKVQYARAPSGGGSPLLKKTPSKKEKVQEGQKDDHREEILTKGEDGENVEEKDVRIEFENAASVTFANLCSQLQMNSKDRLEVI